MEYALEKKLAADGYSLICGVDEAGCGPLAGPVCAAAVILGESGAPEGINDSKKLKPKKREALYEQITARALAWSVAFVDEKEIDEIDILQARLKAMRAAVAGLCERADFALIDGDRDPELDIPSLLVVKGDAQSPSIAAASILAKVSRDRYMVEISKKYPEYLFERHKGYPTKLHYELLDKHGPSPIHRLSFLTKRYGALKL